MGRVAAIRITWTSVSEFLGIKYPLPLPAPATKWVSTPRGSFSPRLECHPSSNTRMPRLHTRGPATDCVLRNYNVIQDTWLNDTFIIICPSFVREYSFQRASFQSRSRSLRSRLEDLQSAPTHTADVPGRGGG